MSSLKKSVKKFVLDAHKAHEYAKSDLLKAISNNQLTGTFGAVHVDNAMRAESLVNALPLTPEYLESDDFANVSEEKFRDWAIDLHRGVKSRSDEIALNGFDPKYAWSLSGVSQLRVFLERALAEHA